MVDKWRSKLYKLPNNKCCLCDKGGFYLFTFFCNILFYIKSVVNLISIRIVLL